MKKILVIALVGMGLISCCPTQVLKSGEYTYSGNKKIMDEKIVAQIKKGKSTKEDVKRLLGSPDNFADADGVSLWVYSYHKFKDVGDNAMYMIRIYFDHNNRVNSVNKSGSGEL